MGTYSQEQEPAGETWPEPHLRRAEALGIVAHLGTPEQASDPARRGAVFELLARALTAWTTTGAPPCSAT